MNTLFPNDFYPNPIMRDAVFSKDRKYRYQLTRTWDIVSPTVMFIGLNPSTANEHGDDPTIRRVISFARDNDFGSVCMTNLFALVSPNPTDLLTCPDPVGENDKWLVETERLCAAVVFAWGAFKTAGRDKKIIEMFPRALCLGKSKTGHPLHPLYLPKNLKFQTFKS